MINHLPTHPQVIIVTRATYGEVDSGDASKVIDVTNDVQGLVCGRTLVIERDRDLNAFFRWDPSPGEWVVSEWTALTSRLTNTSVMYCTYSGRQAKAAADPLRDEGLHRYSTLPTEELSIHLSIPSIFYN